MTRLSPKDLPALTALAARATAIEDEVAAKLGLTFATKGPHERTRSQARYRRWLNGFGDLMPFCDYLLGGYDRA